MIWGIHSESARTSTLRFKALAPQNGQSSEPVGGWGPSSRGSEKGHWGPLTVPIVQGPACPWAQRFLQARAPSVFRMDPRPPPPWPLCGQHGQAQSLLGSGMRGAHRHLLRSVHTPSRAVGFSTQLPSALALGGAAANAAEPWVLMQPGRSQGEFAKPPAAVLPVSCSPGQQ